MHNFRRLLNFRNGFHLLEEDYLTASIEELGVALRVPYDHEVAEIAEVQRLLAEVERGLRRLIEVSRSRRESVGSSFFALIRRPNDAAANLGDLVDGMSSHMHFQKNLRPSVGEGNTMVARLVKLWTSRSPDELRRHLVPALALHDRQGELATRSR
jgi:hypothetical protein